MNSRRCVLAIVIALLLTGSFVAQNAAGDDRTSSASLESPSGVAVDKDGNVFIAERRGNRVRRVDARTGEMTTVAGTGERGFSGDGGKAVEAKLSNPEIIAIDHRGRLLITDRSNSRIREVDLEAGTIRTVAGTGETGYAGDGGKSAEAKLRVPFGIAVGPDGSIYIADTHNHSIRKIDPLTGIITTVAGSGEKGFSGDGGPAKEATMNEPHVLAVAANGNLIVGDSFNVRIREVDAKTGRIRTLYGTGEVGQTEDGEDASKAKFGYFGSIIATPERLIVSEWINKRIRFIDLETGMLSTLKGPDGIPVEIDGPYGIALDENGRLYVAEANRDRVVRIDLKTGRLEHFAGID